ncbi:MAG: hypothetical protein RI924_1250 [Bacteroidota bacterium]|jgi:hypothetical protein
MLNEMKHLKMLRFAQKIIKFSSRKPQSAPKNHL